MKNVYGIALSGLFNLALMAQPSISSFMPTSGTIGTAVIISGTNFSSIPANDIVYFGGAKAFVSAASLTSLTVIVPDGANFQYISATDITSGLTAYSCKPFIVTFSCNGGINSSSFAAKTDFNPGNHPVSEVIGDIDGDGKLDLVVANAYDNTVSVLLNTSAIEAISFAAPINFTVDANPWAVAAGDIDGDGKLDLAVVNGYSDSISVLRNTSSIGTVSFTPKLDYETGVEPYSVAIGDLDADGKPDLAVANFDSPGTVSVYKNLGAAGFLAFSSKIDFTTGGNPKSVSIADLDGDGKPDLTLADFNTAANTVSILRNLSVTGIISFAPKIDYLTGTNPYATATGDLDGDGKPDIVVPNNGDNSFSVFRNTSSPGTISYAAKIDFGTQNSPVSIAIEDLDGDGKPDVAVTNQFSNSVSIYKNICSAGIIAFAPRVDFTTAAVPYSLALGDIDGVKRPDLVTANASANSISTFQDLQCPTEIQDLDPKSGSFQIYPNPFSSKATLEIKNFKDGNYELRIFNVLGKEIIKTLISDAISTVDSGKLAPDIYFVQLLYKNEVLANEKIIIH